MTLFMQIMIIVFAFLLAMGCSDHPVEVVNVNATQTLSDWGCDYCHINMTESVCYNCTFGYDNITDFRTSDGELE